LGGITKKKKDITRKGKKVFGHVGGGGKTRKNTRLSRCILDFFNTKKRKGGDVLREKWEQRKE